MTQEIQTLNIVALEEGETPYPATAKLHNPPVRVLDILKATKMELEQARTDLNNPTIKQEFDENKDCRDIRAGLHALILNRLQKYK